MSGFMAAGDAVSEALAGFASMQISEPNDIDGIINAAAAWVQDIGYVLFRVANQLAETAIREDVPEMFFTAAAAMEAEGDELSGLTSFALAGPRI